MARPIEKVSAEIAEVGATVARFNRLDSEAWVHMPAADADEFGDAVRRLDLLLLEAAAMLDVPAPDGPKLDQTKRAMLAFALREKGLALP